jgi:GTPase SAR1 family protein
MCGYLTVEVMAMCWILSKFELWKRKVNILVLGAGNSGKTTLCYLLQEDLFSPQYQQQREGEISIVSSSHFPGHQCEISLEKIILNLDDMSGNNGGKFENGDGRINYILFSSHNIPSRLFGQKYRRIHSYG